VALLIAPALLHSQQRADSASHISTLDRYVIDVPSIVRYGTARTLSEVLISQVPGLLVVPGSGLNGSGASVRFAGVRSLYADITPVILLDGVRIDARENDSQLSLGGPGPSRLDDVPIEDVQSIEVLRGAASSAIYGPDAGAGVILIRTKDGTSGPVRIEGFAQTTIRNAPSNWPTNYGGVDPNTPSTLHGGCALAYQAAGYCVQSFVQAFNPLEQHNPFTSAPQRQLGLSMTGGPRWGALRVSGMFDGDAAAYSVPAVTWSDDYRNWSIRGNGTFHPARNIDVFASVAGQSSKLRLPMYQPVQRSLLGPSDSVGFTWDSIFQDPGVQNVARTEAGIGLRARPLPWLALNASWGLDNVDQKELAVIPGERTAGQRTARNHTIALSATAQDLGSGAVRLSTTIGIERLADNDHSDLELVRPDSATCGVGVYYCSTQTTQRDRRVLGVYGIQRLTINHRFSITGTLRHDAWRQFFSFSAVQPNVAVDWIARPERQGLLGKLVLRASYGSTKTPPPGTGTFIFVPIGTTLPTVDPERTRAWELNAEAAGLGDKWHGQVSLYTIRSHVLASVFQDAYGGVYVQQADITNRGVAGVFWGSLVARPAWGIDVRLSVWGNRNRFGQMSGPPIPYGTGWDQTGQRETNGYPANGYWSRPLISFADANGDGIIGANEFVLGPATWAGTPYPTQGASFTSLARFAGRWSVYTTLDYRAGQTLFNETAWARCATVLCREANDPATPLREQAVATVSAYASASGLGRGPTDYFQDADYFKVRELAVAYDVPGALASKVGARTAVISVGARDLLTVSRYPGDPEVGSFGRNAGGTPMVIGDFATVPLRPSWTIRVRVSY